MTFEINCIQDLARLSAYEDGKRDGKRDGKQEGRQEGRQDTLREMLEDCIAIRFPCIAQTTINNILSIADVDVLKSIFNVACAADSLDSFQRDIRGFAPVN